MDSNFECSSLCVLLLRFFFCLLSYSDFTHLINTAMCIYENRSSPRTAQCNGIRSMFFWTHYHGKGCFSAFDSLQRGARFHLIFFCEFCEKVQETECFWIRSSYVLMASVKSARDLRQFLSLRHTQIFF